MRRQLPILLGFMVLLATACDGDGGGDVTDVGPADAVSDGGGADAVVGDAGADVVPLDVAQDTAPPQDVPADVPPPQDVPADVPPPQDVPADVPPPQDVPADVPQPQDVPADVPQPQDVGPDAAGPFGFAIRAPEQHTVACEGGPFGPTELDVMDADWVCTFEHGGVSAHVYLQATATDCLAMMSEIPVFTSPGAWIAVDGQVSALADPMYDYGGNHHNDEMQFTWQGKRYRYYHSSFGFGWRACHPMDCMQVWDASGTTLEEDGCDDAANRRSLPIVCVQVEEGGVVPELVDEFELCPGDPNAGG